MKFYPTVIIKKARVDINQKHHGPKPFTSVA
jgi:hypothetical protein